MSESIGLLVRTFLIGIAVAAPVGAMGVLCMQRTLRSGWRAGFMTGLGIATVDGAYAALAAFGVGALTTMLVSWQTPLRVVGGVLLIYLGVRSALTPPALTARRDDASERRFGLYSSSVALTATNPMTVMAFGAVFAGAGLRVEGEWWVAALATLGVAAGSLAWWLALVTAISLVRHAIAPSALRWVNRISGSVVALFGLLAILSAI